MIFQSNLCNVISNIDQDVTESVDKFQENWYIHNILLIRQYGVSLDLDLPPSFLGLVFMAFHMEILMHHSEMYS